MKVVAFERISDGELFTINEDGETYSLSWTKEKYPDSLYLKYKVPALNDPQYFKPIYENNIMREETLYLGTRDEIIEMCTKKCIQINDNLEINK